MQRMVMLLIDIWAQRLGPVFKGRGVQRECRTSYLEPALRHIRKCEKDWVKK